MKTSSKNIEKFKKDFDLYNFEPNSLIAMSFNFDILKYVIKELINSQKKTNDEILQLKSEFLEHNKHSNDLESSLIEIKLSSNIPPEMKQKLDEEKNKIILKDSEIEKEIKYIKKTKNNNTSKIIDTNSNKVNDIEREKENNDKEIHEKENQNENENKIEINNGIPKEDQLIKSKTEKINKELDNKNIITKKENKENEKHEQNVKDEGKKEKKEQQNNVDILKQIESLASEIQNLKSKELYLEKDFIEFKNSMNENILKNIDNAFPNFENKLNSKIEYIKKLLNEDISKNANEINLLKEDFNKNNSDINKNIKELNSKENENIISINDLKTSNNSLISKINTICDSFILYAKLTDFRQYKNDTFEKINNDKKEISINLSLIQKSLNTLKGQFYDYINNLTDHNNIELLLKKFEIIQNSIYKLQDFEKYMTEKEMRRVILDPNKYVKNEAFNEFVKSMQKIFDTNKKEFNEMRINLDDFKSKESGIKATLKDLKSLEDKIYKKFENLKQIMSEKFVDKHTLNKNTKILEMQTKQLIEENKKVEKSENWLLAKRPVDGHLCASCEAYLGDLSPSSGMKFIPWNKYPSKESNEKIFKISGGVSKILQLVKTKNNNQTNTANNSFNNGSINIDRDINSDRNEKYDNIKSPRTRKNIKTINLNNLTNRNNVNKNIKNYEEDENNNLPMISMTMRKNNSTINIFNSDMINKGTNTTKNINNLKNNLNFNMNLNRKTLQNMNKEDFYLNNEKKLN